jgi:hypothetical protein
VGGPAWGLGGELTTLPRKTQYLLRITTHSLGSGWIIWHNLSTGKRFGTWNVRSLYRSDSLKIVGEVLTVNSDYILIHH